MLSTRMIKKREVNQRYTYSVLIEDLSLQLALDSECNLKALTTPRLELVDVLNNGADKDSSPE